MVGGKEYSAAAARAGAAAFVPETDAICQILTIKKYGPLS